jgi:hypothetical protein
MTDRARNFWEAGPKRGALQGDPAVKRLSRTALTLAALSAGACTPVHFSVAVASSPTHVTYAQRHDDSSRNDYLVDCQVGPNGTRHGCDIIELRGAE